MLRSAQHDGNRFWDRFQYKIKKLSVLIRGNPSLSVVNNRLHARDAFTLVEGLIVLAVLAVLLAAGLYFLNQRERARYQAIANSEPGKVFRVECAPVGAASEKDQPATFTARLYNTTEHRLDFQIWDEGLCWLWIENDDETFRYLAYARITHVDDWPIEDDEDPTAASGGDVGISVLLANVGSLQKENLALTITTKWPHIPIPPGTYSANLVLDTCGECDSTKHPAPDHYIVSPAFPLTITPTPSPD
jgi:prepilin-type N-terminal cleavage/methylation domain-containing protein